MLKELLSGNTRALAKAITLVESSLPEEQEAALELLSSLPIGNALKIGISGPPGAGKSTLVELLGLELLSLGVRRLAVLAIDPSSPETGGSLLGDKTRMQQLAKNPNVFIRPSPAGRQLGGVAQHTESAIKLCEAAGFDTILIESVGVGQSESSLANLVNIFILLLPPAAGDELQALKRGVIETADIIVINKHDGDLAQAAERAMRTHQAALHLKGKTTPILLLSTINKTGVQELLTVLKKQAKGFPIGV